LAPKTQERKNDHLDICLRENVQARKITTGFEDLHLVHNALPEINLKDIDTSTTVFNHRFTAPIIVEAMTGGTSYTIKINVALARAVQELGLGMGVGSQRVALENPDVETSFKIVRKEAPEAFVIANLGAVQLTQGYGVKEAKKAVQMLKADALAIHLNPLQEAIQFEGETSYTGVTKAIQKIAKGLKVPVLVKETGCGIASPEAEQLESIGVAGIDVAGAGGTSWAAVEYFRAKDRDDEYHQQLGEAFWDWGISTAASLIEVVQKVRIPVIASGGIRSGIDAAKALAVGSSLVGMAYPVLEPAVHGSEEVKKKLRVIIGELRNAMFLVGASSLAELKKVPVVATGKMNHWLKARGIEPQLFARRNIIKR
jgi:isopentenyl-diphosphate delta-isomerase